MRQTPPLTFPMMIAAPLLVMLASCVGPAARPPVTPAPRGPVVRPVPAPVAPAPSSPAPGVSDTQPTAAGSWTYRTEPAGSIALFGASAADGRFSIRCDRADKRVRFIRAGMSAGQSVMVIRTSFGAVTWPATASSGARPEIVAIRAASDPTLDQIAYSRGRFSIEGAGLPMLVLPAWAEVARVIEDCRG
ncbi:MAG: hypothetical protein PSY12_11010 [bacterium]|nr:hypothetical protein [bacterium]